MKAKTFSLSSFSFKIKIERGFASVLRCIINIFCQHILDSLYRLLNFEKHVLVINLLFTIDHCPIWFMGSNVEKLSYANGAAMVFR